MTRSRFYVEVSEPLAGELRQSLDRLASLLELYNPNSPKGRRPQPSRNQALIWLIRNWPRFLDSDGSVAGEGTLWD